MLSRPHDYVQVIKRPPPPTPHPKKSINKTTKLKDYNKTKQLNKSYKYTVPVVKTPIVLTFC